MTSYYEIEPEVAGGLGDSTEIDRSGGRTLVTKLHYVFDGWLGDSIIESHPCFVVTKALGDALVESRISGFELRGLEVSQSETFEELYPDRTLPEFRWLQVTGTACSDDFGISDEHLLVVSASALEVIQKHGCDNCDISKVS
ncbi:MAG: hypothetical protein AAF664_07245 [Planctomycetota bacterium]